jgi:hypothetical protein
VGSLVTRSSTGLRIVAAVLAVLVVGLVALLVGVTSFNWFGTSTVDRSGPTLLESIRELEEFTAAEGSFVQDVDLERDVRFVPGFLAGQRVVALVTGTVRATVDFGQLDERSVTVDDDRRTIRLRLPQPQLASPDIDESSARIISRNRGLVDRASDFFAANPTDDRPVYEAAEERIAAAARSSELLEEARRNTERWLETFLGAAGFERVEITWADRAE